MVHIFSIQSPLAAPSPFVLGVPLPKGRFSANGGFNVHIGDTHIECHTKVTGLWSDKSVRWLLIEGILPTTTEADIEVMLSKSSYAALNVKPKCVVDTGSAINIHMRDRTVSMSKTQFLHLSATPCVEFIAANVQINEGAQQVKNIKLEHQTYYDGMNKPLFCDISQTAQCVSENGQQLRLIANLRCYFALNKIDMQVKVHNPQPQIHHGGKWDLGNENSLLISEFNIQHKCADAANTGFSQHQAADLQSTIAQLQSFSTLELVQHSSGGEAWNSPNHKLADNKVHLTKKGASCILDGVASDILRANPSIGITSNSTQLVILPQRFWQKFPMSASTNAEGLSLCFTDLSSKQSIELQPGEIKSHNVSYIIGSLNSANNVLLAPPELKLAPNLLSSAKVLPWFDVSCKEDKLQALVDLGLNGKHNFFAKREALDEFGWRNFGDIYADHEAQIHDGTEPFVSHYNNQYDPLYGFLKQWLVTNDIRWKTLADDLFDHLIHIDLYHTDLDKPEYNHGLFWHTDHYVQAQTATHRTYSQHQQADVYIDHTGGGGPGAHHCYTSGLALYYWLTGNPEAYKSLQGMMQWMSNIYEGDQTLLGLFLRVKNANHVKLPFSNKLLLGSGTGVVRNVFTNQYPLDRGTGNYVNVLLDSFELTQDLQYLTHAEQVILRTISEHDDITQRNFDDIENTWFYVVLLQSVAKYLYIASALDEVRPATQSVLTVFLLYSDYIKTYETPYLTHKERLEYPNDTWTAQDLRKVQILSCAALLTAGQQRADFLKKANELQTWIEHKLKQSDEKEYTRLLVLMMQNYGSVQLVNTLLASEKLPALPLNRQPHQKQTSRPSSTWQRCMNFAKQYSLSKERRHLVQRLPKLQKWLGKP